MLQGRAMHRFGIRLFVHRKARACVYRSWQGAIRASCAGILLAVASTGCTSLPRNPVPPPLVGETVIPGMPDVRAWAGKASPAMEKDYRLSLAHESPADFPRGADGRIRYPYLALSGGGSSGAFGAGFLKGWSDSGERPVFKIVTGVSTGALMAPFAFLGSGYDEALHRFYTTTRTRDVFTPGSPLVALMRRDAVADTTPLAGLIEQYVDAALLQEIATAHRQGRRLYVGTVDLDSRRFSVWNMGLIAERGDAAALALFRRIMLASSSVPVAFPPVLFEVEAGGRRYDEMHVDGFVGANVFLNAGTFDMAALYRSAGRGPAHGDIFVIHNGQLHAPPGPTPRSLRGIALRSVEAAGRAGVVGDLFREFTFASQDAADFHWVTIDENVVLPDPLAFDPAEMTRLYDAGYRAAASGPAWRVRPPGLGPGALASD
jgi:hypothetical protein